MSELARLSTQLDAVTDQIPAEIGARIEAALAEVAASGTAPGLTVGDRAPGSRFPTPREGGCPSPNGSTPDRSCSSSTEATGARTAIFISAPCRQPFPTFARRRIADRDQPAVPGSLAVPDRASRARVRCPQRRRPARDPRLSRPVHAAGRPTERSPGMLLVSISAIRTRWQLEPAGTSNFRDQRGSDDRRSGRRGRLPARIEPSVILEALDDLVSLG